MNKMMAVLCSMAAAAAFAAQADEQPARSEPAKPEAAETAELKKKDTPPFEASLQFSVVSAYVSHNRIFSDTPAARYDVWLQANLPEKFGWVAFDIWANQELNKRHSSPSRGNGGKQFGGIGEFDYEIVYGNSIGPVNITASHLWYTFPRCTHMGDSGKWPARKFWTVYAECDNDFVVPSVKFFWEYRHDSKPDEGFMIDFALSRGFKLTEQLSLKLTSKATLFASEYAKHLSRGALTDTVFGGWDNGVSLSYALTDSLSLGAYVNYLYKIDHRVRHCPGWDSYSAGGRHGSHDGFLYGGVSVCLSF